MLQGGLVNLIEGQAYSRELTWDEATAALVELLHPALGHCHTALRTAPEWAALDAACLRPPRAALPAPLTQLAHPRPPATTTESPQ